jgi:hypothetical protein
MSMFRPLTCSLFLLLITAGSARADELERVPPVQDALVQKECGSCHMAFQPAFLPRASWRAILGGLSKHFGEDASLTAEQVQQIEAYLVRGAGPDRKEGAPLRITELRWWIGEHGPGEVPPSRWKDEAVRSKANCVACHPAAEKGSYEETRRGGAPSGEEGADRAKRQRRHGEDEEDDHDDD